MNHVQRVNQISAYSDPYVVDVKRQLELRKSLERFAFNNTPASEALHSKVIALKGTLPSVGAIPPEHMALRTHI